MISPSLRDRIRGCLLGMAIGEALGAPAQGGALERNGFKGTGAGDRGMALAGCRAFILNERMGRPLEECLEIVSSIPLGPRQNATGTTLERVARSGMTAVGSGTKGALMRISPLVAIYCALKGMDVKEAATLAFGAMSAHGDPLAGFTAVECALGLISIFSEDSHVPEDLFKPGDFIKPMLETEKSAYRGYLKVRHVPMLELPSESGLWMWREILENCFGLYEGDPWCIIPDFDEGILKVVKHICDRHTAGVIAGALLGAYWGEKGIADKCRSKACAPDRILDLAEELILLAAKRSPQ